MKRDEPGALAEPTDQFAHLKTLDEATWFFYDWLRRDQPTALIAAVEAGRTGRYPGLAARLIESMAADHQFAMGLATTLRRPVQPVSMRTTPQARQAQPRGRGPARR